MSTFILEQLSCLVNRIVQKDYLEHVWKRMHDRDVEKASNWLLDHMDELPTLEKEWKQEKMERLGMLERFTALDTHTITRHIPMTEDAAPAKIRYLNGEVVSSKGEKFIVQSKKEEWDGGSRGKVKTKGKRGKGYV